MAIYGIGIDLVRLERVQRMLARWGERFEARVFSESEREDCAGRIPAAPCFALRFAAKEAFVKALGTGVRAPVRWRDVQVRNDELGRPFIELSERAENHCRLLGIRGSHLSLTDDGEYGAAVVLLET